MKIGWIFAAWNSGCVHCGNLIAVFGQKYTQQRPRENLP
jgi:hypothetical protein